VVAKPLSEDSPPWGTTTKAIVASALLILGALTIWRFGFLLTPLVTAGIIAYLLGPLVDWLCKKINISRVKSVLIIYPLLLILLGIGGAFLGLVVVEQGSRMWGSLPDMLLRLVENVQGRAEAVTDVVWRFGPYTIMPGLLLERVNWSDLATGLRTAGQNYLANGGTWLASVARTTVSTLGDALLVLFVSIYLAMDAPRIGQAIVDLAHHPGYRKDTDRLLDDTLRIWNAYLRGQIVLGIVIGVIVTISLSIIGVNSPVQLGLVSGLLEFLPMVGPVIGAGAAVLVALLQGSNPWGLSPWLFATIVLGVMILIQQVENAVLVPRIVGDALDLHPLVVLIGVIMGTSLGGLLGAILAAPVIATLKLYGLYIWNKMLDLPPFTGEEEITPTEGEGPGAGLLEQLRGLFRSNERAKSERKD
jgi:predicted PurR-regulated permease PerM